MKTTKNKPKNDSTLRLQLQRIKWKNGTRFLCDPEIAYEELESIRKTKGKLVPETVLEAARDNDNPLHLDFEWNNEIAGHKYRMNTARKMIGSIEVVYAQRPSRPVRMYSAVSAEHAARSEQRFVFAPTREILTDPRRRQELLSRALQDLTTFSIKYHDLSELSPVFQAIEKVSDELHPVM